MRRTIVLCDVLRHELRVKPVSLLNLSTSEKLQLAEDLWDELAADPSAVPVQQWHKDELARRKDNLAKHPESALTWDEVKRRIRAKHGR